MNSEVMEQTVKSGQKTLDERLTEWRNLALQFDNQRMAAVWHLRAMVDNAQDARKHALTFLAAAPRPGRDIAKEVAKHELDEEFIARIMNLVSVYGRAVKLRGHSAFKCDEGAYQNIEDTLRCYLKKEST